MHAFAQYMDEREIRIARLGQIRDHASREIQHYTNLKQSIHYLLCNFTIFSNGEGKTKDSHLTVGGA